MFVQADRRAEDLRQSRNQPTRAASLHATDRDRDTSDGGESGSESGSGSGKEKPAAVGQIGTGERYSPTFEEEQNPKSAGGNLRSKRVANPESANQQSGTSESEGASDGESEAKGEIGEGRRSSPEVEASEEDGKRKVLGGGKIQQL